MPLQWPPEFALGDAEIDATHCEIVDQVNRLIVACMEGRGTAQVRELLDFFQQHVLLRFEAEERLMRACRYPERTEHQRMHADFARKIRQLRQELQEDAECDEALGALNEAVIDWVFDHLFTADRVLGDFVRSPKQHHCPSRTPALSSSNGHH